MTKNWFPIKIKVSNTKETIVVKSSKDLPKGVPYKVLETRVKVR